MTAPTMLLMARGRRLGGFVGMMTPWSVLVRNGEFIGWIAGEFHGHR
jgi:lauroyl/myristoyl acyltransferase